MLACMQCCTSAFDRPASVTARRPSRALMALHFVACRRCDARSSDLTASTCSPALSCDTAKWGGAPMPCVQDDSSPRQQEHGDRRHVDACAEIPGSGAVRAFHGPDTPQRSDAAGMRQRNALRRRSILGPVAPAGVMQRQMGAPAKLRRQYATGASS